MRRLYTKCPPVSSQDRSPVAGDVSYSDAAGLRKRQHPSVSAQATSVGDELHCSAAVLIVAVAYDHITPLLRQLHWLKARERIDFRLALLSTSVSRAGVRRVRGVRPNRAAYF